MATWLLFGKKLKIYWYVLTYLVTWLIFGQNILICISIFGYLTAIWPKTGKHFLKNLVSLYKKRKKIYSFILKSKKHWIGRFHAGIIYFIYILSYFYSTTKYEMLQIGNHNLLCSLDPPNQGWLFWVVGPKLINDTEYNWLHISRYVFGRVRSWLEGRRLSGDLWQCGSEGF